MTESHAPDADIAQCAMEVWGDLTLRGAGYFGGNGLAVRGPRCAGARGGRLRCRCPGQLGAGVTDEAVAGVIAGDMAVGGGRVVAVGVAPAAGVQSYGVYLQDAGAGDGSGRVQAFRRCLVARRDWHRWRCCMHGRVACRRRMPDALPGGAFGAGGVA